MRFAGMYVAVNVEGFTRPFAIGRVLDARDPNSVSLRWYCPKDAADPIAAAWAASPDQQAVARAAVRMTFELERGGRLPAAVQDDLRSISAAAAAKDDAASGAESAGSGSSSGAASLSGGSSDSSSLPPESASGASGGAGAGSGSGSGSGQTAALRRTTRSSAKSRGS